MECYFVDIVCVFVMLMEGEFSVCEVLFKGFVVFLDLNVGNFVVFYVWVC